MAEQTTLPFRTLEGHRVGVALADGTRIDDCQLVCAPRVGLSTIWLALSDGADVFVPVSAVIDMWEWAA